MKEKSAPPPKHLEPETRNWFAEIAASYELESPHLRLLQLAAEAWDRCQEARAQLAKDGITFQDRFGNIRPHPAAGIERDARTAFARLLRELNLDLDEAPPEAPRPPPLKY